MREGYGVSISIEYDTTDKKTGIKKSYWIRIGKVSPLSPLSPPDDNYEKNQDKNLGTHDLRIIGTSEGLPLVLVSMLQGYV